jgi:uncharacterized protein (TIGR03435 family)
MVRSRLLGAVGIISVVGAIAVAVSAQTPAAPAFEVASVKPSPVGAGPEHHLVQFRGGLYIAHYVTVQGLIGSAYDVQARYQVMGGPSWFGFEHFDIEAKAPGIPDNAQGLIPRTVLSMTRALLEDRFRLTTHFEQRELPVYVLTLARQDGKLGPRLQQRTYPCTGPAPPPAPQNLGRHGTCGGEVQRGMLTSTGTPMAQLAIGLAAFVPDADRVVIDRTGLGGTFDIDLNWTPDAPSNGNPTPLGSSSAPSFFTALRDQLGLKLEPTKGPVDVLVIDHVERPTAD